MIWTKNQAQQNKKIKLGTAQRHPVVVRFRKGKNYKKRTSKLEQFRSEIAKMYTHGASLELIALHLETEHKQYAARSTILRYIHSIGVTRNG